MKIKCRQLVLTALVLAILCWPESLAAQPRYPDEVVAEARPLFNDGKIDEVLQLLKDAEKKDSTLPPARLYLARWLHNANRAHAARQQLEIALEENPRHPLCYLENGSVALSEGRLAETILNCQMALQFADLSRWTRNQRKEFKCQAHAGLATTFENRREWDNARKHFEAWIDLLPVEDKKTAGSLYVRLAFAVFSFDDREKNDEVKEKEILDLLKNAAEANADLGPPEMLLGAFYSRKVENRSAKKDADIKKAGELFQKALSADQIGQLLLREAGIGSGVEDHLGNGRVDIFLGNHLPQLGIVTDYLIDDLSAFLVLTIVLVSPAQ